MTHRSRSAVYDDLLRFQADLSGDLESAFFRSCPAWETARQVLDFGSGNGYYSRSLARSNPDKSFTCVDQDAALVELSKRWTSPFAVTSIVGTYSDMPDDSHFDFVFARHALSYLDDRQGFLEWVAAHTSVQAGLLVIDADDDVFSCTPRLPLLERGNDQFKEAVAAHGGTRDVAVTLREEAEQAGFSPEWTHQLIVHSDIKDRKFLMYMFMRSVAELDHGSPLPANVWREIDDWSLDPSSYLQYGLKATYFSKRY